MSENNETAPNNEALEWKPDFTFTPNGNCRFKQRGPYLVCCTCELEHAKFIGMNKRMVGEKPNGEPILAVIS
jgi:hypothetical protein